MKQRRICELKQALRATFHLTHELGAWTLGTLAAGHAAAALIHHFVLRDDVLECMEPMIDPALVRGVDSLARGPIPATTIFSEMISR